MDEEKTIDEAVEEQADEMKEFEPVAFDEVIKETEPERKDAPVLRAVGDPEPADMNMIHKHLDNFLAKIAGETPIDDNVRDSTEYWLNRIAEAGGGGGTTVIANPELAGTEDALTGLQVGKTKYIIPQSKMYLHLYYVGNGDWCVTLVLPTSSAMSATQLAKWLYDHGCISASYCFPVSWNASASTNTARIYKGLFSGTGTQLQLAYDTYQFTTDGSNVSVTANVGYSQTISTIFGEIHEL